MEMMCCECEAIFTFELKEAMCGRCESMIVEQVVQAARHLIALEEIMELAVKYDFKDIEAISRKALYSENSNSKEEAK